MRNIVTVCLLSVAVSVAACGTTLEQAAGAPPSTAPGDGRAPLSAFVPPTPAGCAGAQAYDVCLAITAATPLAVRVTRPAVVRPDAVAVVRFQRVEGARGAFDFDHANFRVGAARELRLYFQLSPGAYRISVGVDADGDGDPEGPGDDLGWSAMSPDVAVVDEAGAALVDVGTTPVETSFALATRR